MLHGLVMDMYDQFVGMVAEGRHMDPAKVRELADGRAYTGRQALKLGLVDAIGGEREARDWLARPRASLPTCRSGRSRRSAAWPERHFRAALAPLVDGMWKIVLSQGLTLDGAWAIWQRSDH